MDTFVTIHVVTGRDRSPDAGSLTGAVTRAFGWFHDVEARCSRFDAGSELSRLTSRVDEDVPVSTLLFEAIAFALAVARETDGLFDPTIGHAMQRRGFTRHYRTGVVARMKPGVDPAASYRDIEVNRARCTVRLGRPLQLDLGAVAKGLAIDLAARELGPFRDFAIDAGGDLYLGGRNPEGSPWSVGIRHPRTDAGLVDVLRVSDRAVCTSGHYERPGRDGHGHVLDPRTGKPADRAVSATVIAPTAILADTLATAAFVLGPTAGITLIERHGAEGLLVSPSLERFTTRGYPR